MKDLPPLSEEEHEILTEEFNRRNVQTKYSVKGFWFEHYRDLLMCGIPGTFCLNKKWGVQHGEKSEMSGTIKVGIMKDILNLSSEVAQKVNTEWSFNTEEEKEITKTYPCPECGKVDVGYYQYRIRFYITRRRKGFLFLNFKPYETFSTIWTNKFRPYHDQQEWAEECKCRLPDSENDNRANSGRITKGGKKQLFAEINKNIGISLDYQETDRGIEIPALNLVISEEEFANLFYRQLVLKKQEISNELIDLADINTDRVVVHLKPSFEAWTDELDRTYSKLFRREIATLEQKEREQPLQRRRALLFTLTLILVGGGLLRALTGKRKVKRAAYRQHKNQPSNFLLWAFLGGILGLIMTGFINLIRQRKKHLSNEQGVLKQQDRAQTQESYTGTMVKGNYQPRDDEDQTAQEPLYY